MNGVYDFEQFETPYLDVEMLMNRKAQKRKKKLLILSGIATMLATILVAMLLYLVSTVNEELFRISYSILSIYIIVGALVIGMVVKKGEYLCQY